MMNTIITLGPSIQAPEAVEALKQNLRGELLLPEEEGYDKAHKIWHERIKRMVNNWFRSQWPGL